MYIYVSYFVNAANFLNKFEASVYIYSRVSAIVAMAAFVSSIRQHTKMEIDR